MMNSNSFPSATHAIFDSSTKPLISSHNFFKFNATPSRRRNTTVKASVAVMPAPEKETLYDLLGVSENGTSSEIKQAYKKMALKYHPDVSPPDRAEEYTVKFIRVQEAYETLSDPQARFLYDSCMAKGFAYSGRRETRFDSRSDWKDTWEEQLSELQRRSRVQARGMSWAERVRMQRTGSCVNGSDPVA